MAQTDYQRQQLNQKSNSSDIPKAGYASTLSGALPTAKRRRSPFDRLGAAQWAPKKGQVSNSYAG